jgi:uncharacterized protein (TIRG00374 family)
MQSNAKRAIKFILRWGIAVAGIGWVLWNISLHDRVMVLNPQTQRPKPVRLAAPAQEVDATFRVYDPFAGVKGTVTTLRRDELLVRSDMDRVQISEPGGSKRTVEILGLKVTDGRPRETWPMLVARPRTFWMKYTGGNWGDAPQLIEPSRVVGDYVIRVPYPIIETGLGPMTRQAFANKPIYLILAVLVFPVTYLITSYRWHLLLNLLQIRVSLMRAFVINMVGAFYNTFMPGSTGGDVLKAYYASKQTTEYRTRAIMSVIVDRILGLLALVILGGTMAAYQYFTSDVDDSATRKCGQVALGSAAILVATLLGLLVFYNPLLRRLTGLDFVIRRLPMQRQVNKAIDTMEVYRHHWPKVAWAILITLPVHMTVVLSAMFAGMAFGLPMQPWYYWIAVPVIVLSGAVPISPQGAGVMEFFAILLTRSQGVTISQAFALTMSIRCVQILWNLTGGIFVLRGGFHAPTDAEQQALTNDASDTPPAASTGDDRDARFDPRRGAPPEPA